MPEFNEGGRFTPGEFKVASWWVRNGLLLRRIARWALIVLACLFWGYAAWGLIDAYAISYPRESRLTRDIALNQELLFSLESKKPQAIKTSEVLIAQTTNKRLDMSVEATNPNDEWWADFSYRFSVSGEETPTRSGYLLPQSRTVLTELGYAPTSRGGRSATLIVDAIHWHRVDPSVVGGKYADYAARHLMLEAKDVKYDTSITLGTHKVGQTSFTLVNTSAYGFWSVRCIVRLFRGGGIVATNEITVTNLLPNEERVVQLTWPEPLPGITKTEIIPEVNILDPSVYLPSSYL